ncbi:MAG: DUF3795 domain-containing protein [Candidatus Cloacimonetes bacterium]|nr:DUF3795 domain-containing protein [Candidatus Cloacimonadota bacterium]
MNGLESFCGLYCGACLCNIVKDEGTVAEVADKLSKTVEQLTCTNCKTELHQDCSFVVCCTAKGLNNCSECPELPCEEISKFAQDGIKHHALVIPNLLRIREIGLEVWLEEQKQQFTCQTCGTRLSWNTSNCDKCGAVKQDKG